MKLLILSISLLLMTGYTYSQEKSIAFFEEEGISIIKSEFAEKAKLFTEYAQFKEAKLYRLADSSFAVEIFYVKDQTDFKDRTIYSKEELHIYLDSIQKIISANYQNFALDQSGRTPLLISSSILGLSYYGVLSAIYIGNHSSDFKGPLSAYMLGAGASYAIPYFLTKDKNVTKAQASMIFHGQTRGAFLGLALANSFKPTLNDSDFSILSSMSVSVGAGVLNNYIAKTNNYNIGQASTFQMAVDAGIINGALLGVLFQKDYDYTNDYKVQQENQNKNERILFGTILTSSIVHGYLGKRVADKNNYTLGDAIFMRNSGVLGSIITLPFLALSENSNDKVVVSSLLAGEVVGSIYGAYALKGKEYSNSDGALLTLSHVSGGLLGTGLGVLLVPNKADSKDGAIIATGTAVGSLAGFFIMKNALDKKYKSIKKDEMSLNFNINPMGLYGKRLGFNSEQLGSMPIVNMNLTF